MSAEDAPAVLEHVVFDALEAAEGTQGMQLVGRIDKHHYR